MIVIKKTTGDLLIDTGMQYLILPTFVKEKKLIILTSNLFNLSILKKGNFELIADCLLS